MPATPTLTNGKVVPPTQTTDVLPFLHPEQNSYRRLSINSAFTFRRASGEHDVAHTLFDELLRELQSRPADAMDLDALKVSTLLTTVEQRLQGVNELADVGGADLGARLQMLRDLSSRKSIKIVRQINDISATTVAEAILPLRAALQGLLQRTPFHCAMGFDEVQRSLRDLSFPTPDFSPAKRLSAGLSALQAIERSARFPAKLREALAIGIRKRCDTQYQLYLDAIVLDFVCQALRQAVLELHPLIDELRAGQAMFHRNIDSVRQHLEQLRILTRQRSSHGRSSVDLELATPDHDQLLAGIRTRQDCEDRVALAARFADKLQCTLNEIARVRCPFVRSPATLTDLLSQLPPQEIAVGILDVVAHLVGDIHTVYTAVRFCGVSMVARELFERAEPLTHLTSRDHVQLRVEPHRDLLIRLPQPRGADDAEIAEQLREEFREFHPACQFVDDSTDTEITVVRTLVCFPIAIEAGNAGLLLDYAAAAKQGHHPHLFGVVAESPHGKPIPELLALARHSAHE